MNPLRCKLGRRPGLLLADPHFFYCTKCGRLLWDLQSSPEKPACCMEKMREIKPLPVGDAYSYEICGGFEHNAVQLFWKEKSPLWGALRTFSGFYCKIVAKEKKAPLVFPLADEDAYVYCGREKCAKCLYACKKGCALYCYEGEGRLFMLPLTEIAQYFRKNS